jgi:hypothetical protein
MDWHDQYEAALRHASNMQDYFQRTTEAGDLEEADWIAVLRSGMAAHKALAEVLIHATHEAYAQGATKKELAVILEMSPSGLRGLQR